MKWAVVERDTQPRLLQTGRVATDTGGGEQAVVRQLIEVARAVLRDTQHIASIGVGMPGVLDPDSGITRFIPNIPGNWAGVPVIAEMSKAVQSPVPV